MFLKQELKKLHALVSYDNPTDPLYEYLLDDREQEAIGTQLRLICENLFIPRHNRPVQTLIVKKLFLPEFSLFSFIENLCHSITGKFELRIGISFLVHKVNVDKPEDIKYFFAIHQRLINNDNRLIRSVNDVNDLLAYLKPFNNSDLLGLVFNETNSENPFEKSGYIPRKLVLCVCWLTKINGSI